MSRKPGESLKPSKMFQEATKYTLAEAQAIFSKVKLMKDSPSVFELTLEISSIERTSKTQYHMKFIWEKEDDSVTVVKA